jgi:hypothetical protein
VSTDFSGIARPQGEAYDMGAYEYQSLPVMTGLTANWRLDETSGTTAVDSYGLSDGDILGATINQPGQVNTAYGFDGVDDKVQLPLMNYDQLTVSAWFYRDTVDGTNADTIFGGWHYQAQEGYSLRFDPNSSRIDFILCTTNGTDKTVHYVDYDLSALGGSTGRWYHVAGTYDKATGLQTLYVNGVAVNSAAHPAGNTVVPLHTYDTNMFIGFGYPNNGYFDGRIDDVKVFNRPLTAEEVAQEYQYGSLMAHWALDEKQVGTTAYDDTLRGGRNGSDIGGITVNSPGRIDTAYDFNGTDAAVSVPLMNYDEITVSAWFYRDIKDATNADTIFGGWHYQAQEGYSLRFNPNSDAVSFILVTQTSGGVKTYVYTECSYNLGSASVGYWYYVASTYNKATGVQTLYVNGAPVATSSHPAGNTIVPLHTYDTNMFIGFGYSNSGYFDGRIDDVCIYARPLTTGEIMHQYAMYSPPMVSSVTPNPTTVADANVGTASFWLTLVYNEPMNTAVAPAIAFPVENPSGTLTFNAGASGWSNNTTYVAKYNVADANVALANIDVRATGAMDAAGNTQVQGDFANTFGIDTRNPTVTINQASGQADPTKTSPVNFTVVFSEAVSDFVTSDVTVSGTAPGTLVGTVTGGGTTYNVAVSGMTGEGSVIASIAVGKAHDAAGNSNAASTSTDNTVMFDPTPVTVQSIVVNDGNAQRSKVSSLTVTFSEIVAVDAGAFEVRNKGTSQLVTVAHAIQTIGGKTVATLTFTNLTQTDYYSLKDGEYQLTVYGGKVHDSDTGTNLDGDGDGQFGGNRVFGALAADNFFRKFGDSDGDRDVDSVDLLRFRQAYSGTYKWYFDFEGDGDVDSVDLLRFRQRYA